MYAWSTLEAAYRALVPEVNRPDGEHPTVLLEAASWVLGYAENLLRDAVIASHERGMSWTQIGRGLGITKQAAHERFAGEVTAFRQQLAQDLDAKANDPAASTPRDTRPRWTPGAPHWGLSAFPPTRASPANCWHNYRIPPRRLLASMAPPHVRSTATHPVPVHRRLPVRGRRARRVPGMSPAGRAPRKTAPACRVQQLRLRDGRSLMARSQRLTQDDLATFSGVRATTPDLRRTGCPAALARAERELGVRLDASRAVIKRRTWGAPSDAGTWVRLQAWPADDPAVDKVPGVVAASALTRVPRPEWFRGVRWDEAGLVWRADELEFVQAPPVIPAGTLTTDPGVSDAWWRGLARALDAVATTAVPLPRQTVTQQRFRERITSVFGSGVDTTVTIWGGLHGDMAFANLTAPALFLLDWEEFGRGPAGLDHARLWADSLAAPDMAQRCAAELAPYLDTRQGLLCRAYALVPLLALPAGEPLREPAERAAGQVADALRR